MSNKIKSVVVTLRSVHNDQFPEWDKSHHYPKTDPVWTERVSGLEWNAYNDTYRDDDKFAVDRDPFRNQCVDGIVLETDNSTVDRFTCAVHDKAAYNDKALDDTGRKIGEMIDRAMAGEAQALTETFVDAGDEHHVTTITVAASRDFYDLTDDVKLQYGEKWYRRWYDENKKRGLVDFPYSFPATKLPRGAVYADCPLKDVIAEYTSQATAGWTKLPFMSWLDEKINDPGENPLFPAV